MTQTIAFNLPADLYEDLKKYCEQNKLTISAIGRGMVEALLEDSGYLKKPSKEQ